MGMGFLVAIIEGGVAWSRNQRKRGYGFVN